MMHKVSTYLQLILLFVMTSCGAVMDNFTDDNPYKEGVRRVTITLSYPEEYRQLLREGIAINITNPQSGVKYVAKTDAEGVATIDLPLGFYRVASSDKGVSEAGVVPLFNGSIDELKIMEESPSNIELDLNYILSFAVQIVIKEIYFAGCLGEDNTNYNADKYLQLYNNSSEIAYLDSLCFGCIYNYNDLPAFTPWSYTNSSGNRVIRDTIPITEAVWQFPGSGKEFPLKPGESTVLAINGAIDHTLLRPKSVNLDKKGYFVCYNQRYTMTKLHPAPGENLTGHWLNLLWKQGRATAYSFSQTSPTAVIFNIRGRSAIDFINDPANRSKLPGSSSANEYIMIPSQWVIDGVEVVSSKTRYNRLPTTVDANAILFSADKRNKGYTIHRKVDAEMTASLGMVVYQDTNNSESDFEIRVIQSIKE